MRTACRSSNTSSSQASLMRGWWGCMIILSMPTKGRLSTTQYVGEDICEFNKSCNRHYWEEAIIEISTHFPVQPLWHMCNDRMLLYTSCCCDVSRPRKPLYARDMKSDFFRLSGLPIWHDHSTDSLWLGSIPILPDLQIDGICPVLCFVWFKRRESSLHIGARVGIMGICLSCTTRYDKFPITFQSTQGS